MVITSITGGLGNQLYQFSAGYTLSKLLKTKLVLDASYFKHNHKRKDAGNYEAHLFKIINTEGVFDIIQSPTYSRIIRVYLKILSFLFPSKCGFNISNEKKAFNYEVLVNKSKNNYINGYWQNLLYHEEKLEEIISILNLENLRKIDTSSVETIGIHVRKGDMKDTKVDICTANYYNNAIEKIIKIKNLNKKDIKIIIFSEDRAWIKDNLNLNEFNCEIVSGDWSTTIEDFKKMSSCNNLVMCNSTYSLWAANIITFREEKSIVIYPDRWSDLLFSKDLNLFQKYWIENNI